MIAHLKTYALHPGPVLLVVELDFEISAFENDCEGRKPFQIDSSGTKKVSKYRSLEVKGGQVLPE